MPTHNLEGSSPLPTQTLNTNDEKFAEGYAKGYAKGYVEAGVNESPEKKENLKRSVPAALLVHGFGASADRE